MKPVVLLAMLFLFALCVHAAVITNTLQGPQGPVGPTGPQGPAGLNGTNGVNGTNGINGTNGATGPQGPPGTNGTNGINGTNGVDGINGTDGAPGPAGTNGTDGLNATANFTVSADAGANQVIGNTQTLTVNGYNCLTVTVQGTRVLNFTVNQTCLDNRYYLVTNPEGFYNVSTVPDFALNSRVTSLNTTAAINVLGFNTTAQLDNRFIRQNGTYIAGDLCEYVVLTGEIVCDVVPITDTNSGFTQLRFGIGTGNNSAATNNTLVNFTAGPGILLGLNGSGPIKISIESTITQYTDAQAVAACYATVGNFSANNASLWHKGEQLIQNVTVTNGTTHTINITINQSNSIAVTFDDQNSGGASATTLPATNISNGTFGSNRGNGNYTFPDSLTITNSLNMTGSNSYFGSGTEVAQEYVNGNDLNFNVTGALQINSTLNASTLLESNNRVCTYVNGICVNVTSYTANGTFTYTVPLGTKTLYIVVYGAGGGGGSAAATAANTARGGGTGGGGGAKAFGWFNSVDLSGTLTVNVGNNGSGGAAATTSAGNPGGTGGPSNVTMGGSILLQAFGGGGGALGALASTAKGGGSGGGTGGPGVNAATSAIAGGLPATATGAVDGTGGGGASGAAANGIGNTAEWGGATGGGAGTAAVSSCGGKSEWGGGGGGGGGSNGLSNVTRVPAAGGQGASGIYDAATTGCGGGAAGVPGTSPNGTAGQNGNFSFAGSGGGGGAYNITAGAPAGNGGAGGLCGGGGGGSGSGNPTSGTGGAGGNGCVFIAAYG